MPSRIVVFEHELQSISEKGIKTSSQNGRHPSTCTHPFLVSTNSIEKFDIPLKSENALK